MLDELLFSAHRAWPEVLVVGYSRRRVGVSGRARYTAYYWDVWGRERSAGTFDHVREADRAWRRAEVDVVSGRFADARSARQSFERYVTMVWLPSHLVEATTRQTYTHVVERYLVPQFGRLRMDRVLPCHVRDFVHRLCDEGVSAQVVQRCRTVLGSIFTTALRDQVVLQHPCVGSRGPVVPPVLLRVLEPEEFESLLDALPGLRWRLLVEVAIESGVRWGELVELRMHDLDVAGCLLTVARTVEEIEPRFHPTGGRFLVKEYPKGRDFRRLRLRRQLVDRVAAYVERSGLEPGDLLFSFPERAAIVDPDRSGGGFAPGDHGTLSRYSARGCRCEACRAVYAGYRASRRAQGKDRPRLGRWVDTDGHLPRRWYLRNIWEPALAAAGITRRVRMHDLRHAHASWLLAGGADVQTVRERLGHASLRATERYLHTLAESDERALAAFERIRHCQADVAGSTVS
jgi:integrase